MAEVIVIARESGVKHEAQREVVSADLDVTNVERLVLDLDVLLADWDASPGQHALTVIVEKVIDVRRFDKYVIPLAAGARRRDGALPTIDLPCFKLVPQPPNGATVQKVYFDANTKYRIKIVPQRELEMGINGNTRARE